MATTFLPLMSIRSGLKRRASSDGEDLPAKIRICSEDEEYSSSGESESISSLQNHETATAYDTSDTDDDRELEVLTVSKVTLSELASEPEEDLVAIGHFSAGGEEFDSEIEYVADLSDEFSSDDSDTETSSLKRCGKCKEVCEGPFALCVKCFKQRRLFLPLRPMPIGGKWRRDGRSEGGDSGLGTTSGVVGSSQGGVDSSEGTLFSSNHLERFRIASGDSGLGTTSGVVGSSQGGVDSSEGNLPSSNHLERFRIASGDSGLGTTSGVVGSSQGGVDSSEGNLTSSQGSEDDSSRMKQPSPQQQVQQPEPRTV